MTYVKQVASMWQVLKNAIDTSLAFLGCVSNEFSTNYISLLNILNFFYFVIVDIECRTPKANTTVAFLKSKSWTKKVIPEIGNIKSFHIISCIWF